MFVLGTRLKKDKCINRKKIVMEVEHEGKEISNKGGRAQ